MVSRIPRDSLCKPVAGFLKPAVQTSGTSRFLTKPATSLSSVLTGCFSVSSIATIRLLDASACGRWLSGVASFAIFLGILTGSANAAGCSHHESTASVDVPAGLTRIYENGRFYFYKTLPPCSGANCGRSDPSSMTSMPAAISSERANPVVFDGPSSFVEIPLQPTRSTEVQSNYSPPAFDEPLRPPVSSLYF